MSRKKNIVLQEVLIEDYAAEGKSLARVDGKVVFVEHVVPGDVVDLRLGKNKKDWAEGFPIHFHKYAADRVTPFCSHFGVCGGCKWQMLPYEKQLQYKQKQVTDQLSRIGGLELPQTDIIIGSLQTQFYRNKMEYTYGTSEFVPREVFDAVGYVESAGVAGFHPQGFFEKVVNIDTCYLQAEPTNILRKKVRDFALQNEIPFYDIKQHTGWLRAMQIRLCSTGQLMVNMIFAYDHPDWQKLVLDYILSIEPSITTLLYTINRKFNDTIYDLEPVIYHGHGYAMETLGNYQFKISPKSFFQTNSKQAERLYDVTKAYAQLDGTQTVYDLYCGTGSIGIYVSDVAKKVIGVETVEDAVKDAKENAAINNITHAEFFAGDVIDVCDDAFFAKHGRPDVIITDPPRAGMHGKLVEKLLEIEAPLIVYVSCNPATQARDLRLLAEKYEVTKIQPVDMFPHTHHIENVVQLLLKTSNNAIVQ